MKMVKSLLLSSAAGLFAVAGAQAADLPVKAKAVEYVKVCTLYGVGYYYIPGTDTCIKIGGYVRYEAYHNHAGGLYPTNTPVGVFTRHSNTFAMMARFRLTTDVRTQTEYGTLRSYVSFGFNFLNSPNEPGTVPANTVGGFTFALERAFIQFAGFTFGRADTFFGFYNGAAYGLVPYVLDGSSGPAGHNVAAYTWQFGNGLSATLSLEDAFNGSKAVNDIDQQLFGGGDDRAGQRVPDIVANLRVDQAWGSAQVMGMLHEVGGRYHNRNLINTFPANNAVLCRQGNSTECTHPQEEWGWAVGAGLTLKMPWDAKDTLSGVIAYGEGAGRAVAYGMGNVFLHKQGVAFGFMTDGVFDAPNIANSGYGGGIELTETWGGTVAFEHYWTPSLRTSWVFGYLSVEYSEQAKRNISTYGAVCTVAGLIPLNQAANRCDPDWSIWRLASRTMWNPVANLDIGVEIAYSKINTSFEGWGITGNAAQGLSTEAYRIQDEGAWSATFRAQRSFWP